MQSCEREPLVLLEEQHVIQSPREAQESPQGTITQYVSRHDVPHVVSKLKPYIQKYRSRQEEPILYIDSIHMDRLKVVSATETTYTDLPYRVYSMFVGSDIPNTLFNIYIEEYPDSTLSAPYVLMYNMDSTFASAYFAGEKGMDSFVGTLSKHEMDVMFGNYLNGQRTIDLEIIIYCWKKVMGDPDGPGGAPGNDPGIGAFPTGTLASSIPTGGIYWIPDDTGDPCTWYIGALTGTLHIVCTGGKPSPGTLWDNADQDRTDYTFDECYRILIMCGIIDERPGIEDGGATPPEPEPTFGEMLAEQLGFPIGTQDFIDISTCIDNSSKQTRMTLMALLSPGVLTDPCNSANTAQEMLHDAVAAGCGNGGGLSEEEIYEFLNNNDHIVNNLTDKRLKCIFEFLSNGSDDLFCNTYENFVGETTLSLNLQNSEQVIGLAQTTPYFLTENSYYGHIIDIAFNQNQLEGLCEVSVVAVFLHEGIHAEMFKLLNDPNIDPEDFETIWGEYEATISQHENMANSYIGTIASALKQRFGSRYSDEEYEAISWIGLGNVNGENVNTSAWASLSQSKKAEFIQLFQQVNNDCNDDQCK